MCLGGGKLQHKDLRQIWKKATHCSLNEPIVIVVELWQVFELVNSCKVLQSLDAMYGFLSIVAISICVLQQSLNTLAKLSILAELV